MRPFYLPRQNCPKKQLPPGRLAALPGTQRSPAGTVPRGHWHVGPNDWLFLDDIDALASHLGLAPLGEARLDAWRRCLEQRSRWLADQGAAHVVVLVPDKASVYPEELPAALRRGGLSRRDEFLAYMAAHSTVRVVDLLPALLLAKAGDTPTRHVYSPHGIHWTEVGELAGAAAILDALRDVFGDVAPPTLADFDEAPAAGQADSWDRRLYLEGALVQREVRLTPRRPRAARTEAPPPGSTGQDRTLVREGGGPRVVVVHDSFGPGLVTHFAEHASRVDGRWRSFFEAGLIQSLRPDVVIEVYSEHALVTQRPIRLAALQGAAEQHAYDDAPVVAVGCTEGEAPRLEPGFDRVSAAPHDGGWRLVVEAGIGLLRVDLGAAPAEGELVLGLDLTSPRAGGLGVYTGVEPWRLPRGIPEVNDLAPVELAAGRQRALVPLAPLLPPGAHAQAVWVLLPPKTGPLDLHAVEVRCVPRTQ